MRRDAAVQAVGVVLKLRAEVVRIVVQAEGAPPARYVCSGHDSVSDPQRATLAVGDGIGASYRLDDADVLVPADEWISQLSLVVRAGVLLGLPPVGVLVSAADTRIDNLQQHGPRLGLGPWATSDLQE